MSYRQIHKRKFKTSDQNLFIIAIKSWSKTLEEINKEFATVENQNDPTRRRICHVANIHYSSYQAYVPLYFANDVPKLNNLPIPEEGFVWCIAEKNPFVTIDGDTIRRINPPPHKEYLRLLKYSLKHLNNFQAKLLFQESVQSYVLKETSDFNDLQKSQRFNIIYNTHLNVLYPKRHEDELKPPQFLPFIEKMYKRDIYEFMFNEYHARAK